MLLPILRANRIGSPLELGILLYQTAGMQLRSIFVVILSSILKSREAETQRTTLHILIVCLFSEANQSRDGSHQSSGNQRAR